MSAALYRFRWVVAAGAVLGVLVGMWMLYELPSFKARNAPVYSAAARLFVTSAEGQYVRLSVPRAVESGDGPDAGIVVVNETPNVEPLLSAANLYPLIIESDDVAQLRESKYGPLPGEVVATAYTSVSTPTRFLPAQLPIIDVVATAETPNQAIALAQATADTFRLWIQRSQEQAEVAPRDRILIKQLRTPREAVPSGGPSFGLPILAALAVISAFAILAVVLDQLLPRDATVRWPWLAGSAETETETSSRRWQ